MKRSEIGRSRDLGDLLGWSLLLFPRLYREVWSPKYTVIRRTVRVCIFNEVPAMRGALRSLFLGLPWGLCSISGTLGDGQRTYISRLSPSSSAALRVAFHPRAAEQPKTVGSLPNCDITPISAQTLRQCLTLILSCNAAQRTRPYLKVPCSDMKITLSL